MTTAVAARNGWHWVEWLAEYVGTAVLMFAVVSAKLLAVRAGSPYSHLWSRIAIVAVVAGVAVVIIALSPLGRRSGAHLNPAVTAGLWLQGAVGAADLAGYVIAQGAGAISGFAAGRLWGGDVTTPPVDWAMIAPSASVGELTAAIVEALATGIQLAVVFRLLADPRGARWAAPVAGALLAVAIMTLATSSGAGFNPVRGLGPDVVAGSYPGLWVFLVGPLAGACVVGLALRATSSRPVTAKLRHDPARECFLACALPHVTRPFTAGNQPRRPISAKEIP